MVVANGRSAKQVVALAKKLREALSQHGIHAKLEGTDTGDWVIVDAYDVIIHLFRPEVRTFYNLEKLWAMDFNTTDFNVYRSA